MNLRRSNADLILAADQGLASLTNALTLAIFASFLSTREFNVFALVQLVIMTSVGMVRALISEPMLALTTNDVVRDPVKKCVAAIAVAGVIGSIVAGITVSSTATAVLVLALPAPIAHDLLRHRAFAFKKPAWSLLADLSVLLSLVGGLYAVHPSSVRIAILCWTLPFVIGTLLLLLTSTSKPRDLSLKPVLGVGVYGLIDTGIAALTWMVPLLVVQGLMTVSSVGAFRLSQSLLGPLNIVASAVVVQTLVRAGDMAHEQGSELRGRANRSARFLILVSLAYVALCGTAALVFSSHIDRALRGQLLYMYPVVAVSSVIASGATAYMAVLRARAQQRRAVPVRTQILGVNAAAFAIGILIWSLVGLDPLVLPIVLTSLVTIWAWRRAFDRYLRELSQLHENMFKTPLL